ncbi:ImmA/IrrE family metallo-endopeptidase [Candidatus Dojkabacteria bacterium]|nr:ImmA/IrrE family metallo-endopeptidase [Candidatus Dojkabacteria bacterium]
MKEYKGNAQMVDVVKKDGKEYAKLISFKSVPVFDISDTEGDEIVKNMTTESDIELETIKKVADTLGYSVSYEALEIAIGGYIAEKSIVLNSNLSESENIGTLIHELAHGELGHTKSSDFTSRSLKEQQAETVTYIVCQMFGVDRKSEFYLKGWRLDENINNSFSLINKAVDSISGMIEKYE